MKTYHLSPTQVLIYSSLIVAVGLAAIYFVDNYYFKNRQLNAAGLNAQAVVAMIQQGENLVSTANQTITTTKNLTAPVNDKINSQSDSKPAAMWQAASNKSGTPTIPLSEHVRVYKIVEVESQPESYPLIGQQINFPLFDDRTVNARVETIEVLPNGDYAVRGHIGEQGDDYPFAMTYGAKSVFASVTTPEGSYSMEALNGLGWLYKNPSEVELSLPGSNDYLEPPKN